MIILNPGQFAVATVEVIDKDGGLAPVQAGSATFTASDAAVVETTLTGDNPYQATVRYKAAGASRVTFKADGDLGDGDQFVEAFEDISCQPGRAAGVRMVFGPVQDS